jgi:hypothetical protein
MEAKDQNSENLSETVEEALRLVNLGRRVGGLEPLATMPKGVIDDPYLHPLGIALEAAIGVGDPTTACRYCHLSEVTVHEKSSEKAAALSTVWATTLQKATWGWTVGAPAALAKFDRDFSRHLYPELIDHDLVPIEEAAKEMKIEVARLEQDIKQKLLPSVEGLCDTFVRRSDCVARI